MTEEIWVAVFCDQLIQVLSAREAVCLACCCAASDQSTVAKKTCRYRLESPEFMVTSTLKFKGKPEKAGIGRKSLSTLGAFYLKFKTYR